MQDKAFDSLCEACRLNSESIKTLSGLIERLTTASNTIHTKVLKFQDRMIAVEVTCNSLERKVFPNGLDIKL